MSADRPRHEALRFRHLTEEERLELCNGCGGKGGWVPVPNFFFEASCDHHDFNYWRGGTEFDRAYADRGFHRAMKRDVARLAWWRRWYGYGLAWTYYRAVRMGGRDFFSYRPRQRGWPELDVAMGRAASTITEAE